MVLLSIPKGTAMADGSRSRCVRGGGEVSWAGREEVSLDFPEREVWLSDSEGEVLSGGSMEELLGEEVTFIASEGQAVIANGAQTSFLAPRGLRSREFHAGQDVLSYPLLYAHSRTYQ